MVYPNMNKVDEIDLNHEIPGIPRNSLRTDSQFFKELQPTSNSPPNLSQ